VAVVLAAAGYPGPPATGGVITGLDRASSNGSLVIHAGTALDAWGRLISAGGRVLAVVGTGDDLGAARTQAYESMEAIELPGGFYRHDIALAASQVPVS
jgi:phosphoribosylamine---glycine ligase